MGEFEQHELEKDEAAFRGPINSKKIRGKKKYTDDVEETPIYIAECKEVLHVIIHCIFNLQARSRPYRTVLYYYLSI